jgi:TRAP-type uncharacterized transport system substrate-binding protein
VFYRGNDPYPLIQEMMEVPGVSFVSMSETTNRSDSAHHPFLHAISIPAGMYGGHAEIETVGGDMLLACRANLADELVYWVTRTLFESLPELAKIPPGTPANRSGTCAGISRPTASGAARFYRERELFP